MLYSKLRTKSESSLILWNQSANCVHSFQTNINYIAQSTIRKYIGLCACGFLLVRYISMEARNFLWGTTIWRQWQKSWSIFQAISTYAKDRENENIWLCGCMWWLRHHVQLTRLAKSIPAKKKKNKTTKYECKYIYRPTMVNTKNCYWLCIVWMHKSIYKFIHQLSVFFFLSFARSHIVMVRRQARSQTWWKDCTIFCVQVNAWTRAVFANNNDHSIQITSNK